MVQQVHFMVWPRISKEEALSFQGLFRGEQEWIEDILVDCAYEGEGLSTDKGGDVNRSLIGHNQGKAGDRV